MKSDFSKQNFNKLLNQSLVASIPAGTAESVFAAIGERALNTNTSVTIVRNWVVASTVFTSAVFICAYMFFDLQNKNKSVVINELKLPTVAESSTRTQVQAAIQRTPIVKSQVLLNVEKSHPQNAIQTPDQTSQVEFNGPMQVRSMGVGQDSVNQKYEDEYIFPVLTDKEIKANEKEKKRLVRMISRMSREKRGDIVKIPRSVDGSVQEFYMGSTEVTNKEFRTFLFDLLIDGRKEEFLNAKPHQHLWKNVENVSTFDFLEKLYFSDKKYNDFPVVNVTSHAAEMYCKWLEEEVKKMSTSDERIPDIIVRLPYENEWVHAAYGGTPLAMYAWPLNSAQNSHHCFMGNFSAQKKKELFQYPIDYGKREIDLNNYTTAGVVLRNPLIATIEAYSYNPTSYGMYGVCGNAAEMVYSVDRSRVLTKGGSWASDFEEIRISNSAELPPAQAWPTIGFRICAIVTH